jgi:hypothetical protein
MDANMQTEQTERLVYDCGKNPLWLRLLFTPVGLGFVWAAYELAFFSTDRHYILDTIAAAASGIFGLAILSLWLPRGGFYFDPVRRQLITRGRGSLWMPWRISLSGAEAVYVEEVKDTAGIYGGGGGPYREIGLRYKGGRDRPLMKQSINDPEDVAAIISEAIGLPIDENPPHSTRLQNWAALICVTAIFGLIVFGTFFMKTGQPEWYMWIGRCFVVALLIGLLTDLWRRKHKR